MTRAFVKTASPRARLAAEVDGLAALRATGTVRVPAVHGLEADGLTLEWLDLRPLDARSAAALGTALAALHRVPQARFGWRRDNYIGATPQSNARTDDWIAFFRERRLVPQLALAQRNGHGAALDDPGTRLLESLDRILAGHAPRPALLHGDLWGGNAGALPDGTPVIFDPAVYVGDREADLAMTELFGGFPPAFYAAYREAWPLDEGYERRRELYNLYHLLNHLNLFGTAYLARCQRTLTNLLQQTKSGR